MSNKKKIINEYKKKINFLIKHNKFYFTQDAPKITDYEFDKVKKETLELVKKNPYLDQIINVSSIVGARPSNKFKKILHLKPMLSLSNAFDRNDMVDFLKKINNFLNLKKENLELFSEPKIDGISATLIYEKGSLVKGLSRGDGVIGEDIL
jgi:DNA ligase (NAD+)